MDDWITIADSAKVLNISYNTMAGLSSHSYYGLERLQSAHGKRQFFNRQQLEAVKRCHSSAGISIASAMKVVVSQSGSTPLPTPAPLVPTFRNGTDLNTRPAEIRLDQIKRQLPKHPTNPETGSICPYHSERYRHIEELLGLCDKLIKRVRSLERQ